MPSLRRRRILASLGVATAGLTGCLADGSSDDFGSVDGAWPMVGRDAGHARRADGAPTDPGTAWTAEPEAARAAGTPSLADGRLYVPVDAVSDAARHRYRLHALEAGDGEERWQAPFRSNPNPAPAVAAGRVVVTARRATELGRVVALGTRYGDEEWLYDVDARVTAPPTVAGTTVYVPDWAGRVHALSVADGSVRWVREYDGDRAGREFPGPVAVHDGTLYLGALSGATGVVAADAETGERRWTASTDRVVAGPVVDDGLVAVRAGTVVEAFAHDGTPLWSFNVPADDWHALALGEDHAYVPAAGSVYAIDRDGEHAWTADVTDGTVGPPTVAGDRVLVRGEDRLVALSRDDGAEAWAVDADGSGSPVAVPGAVFLAASGGRVLALG